MTGRGNGRPGEAIHRAAVKLSALGQNGLAFATTPYDVSRYEQVVDIAAHLMGVLSAASEAELRALIGRDVGYVTPKVDVRGAVFDTRDRVLLMRERVDGLWSLPGGWADPGDSPGQAVVREILEETGYPAEVVKLVAVWDRDTQGHLPLLPVSVYKLFFLCRAVGPPAAAQELETLDVGWFALDELPPLSTGRVMQAQLGVMIQHHRQPALPTLFD